MAHPVEGTDFKHFNFKMLTPKDYPQVGQLMTNNFCSDEPMLKIASLNSQFTEFDANEFQKLFQGVLEQNLSFGVYDKNNGKMAGVRLMCKNLIENKEKYLQIQSSIQSSTLQKSQKFLRQCEAECGDIFSLFQVQPHECANLCRTTVDRDYRGQGLATEMYRRALALLRESGFKMAKTIFTNPHTRQAALHLGFEEMGRKYFREMEDLNGEFICPQAGDDQFASVMAIKL